jgi:hypothetical protein
MTNDKQMQHTRNYMRRIDIAPTDKVDDTAQQ